MTLKIYTPLTADFIPNEPELLDYETEESISMDGYDLAPYKEAIEEALDRENHGGDGWDGNLMEYYHEEDGVKAKVSSAVVSVEYHEGRLCGCATVELSEPLEGDEPTRLMEYLSGQYSDGFGEGFEQRDIAVDGGVLNVHLWQTHGFSMTCERPNPAQSRKPPRRPKMRLCGMDGNIFAILGNASRLLRRDGQADRTKEMADRVFASGSYEQALSIISEYVETELSRPQPPEKRTQPER